MTRSTMSQNIQQSIAAEDLQNISFNPNIGRRTFVDIKKGKVIRKDEFGFENFDDYWTDSDLDESSFVAWQKENERRFNNKGPHNLKVDNSVSSMSSFSRDSTAFGSAAMHTKTKTTVDTSCHAPSATESEQTLQENVVPSSTTSDIAIDTNPTTTSDLVFEAHPTTSGIVPEDLYDNGDASNKTTIEEVVESPGDVHDSIQETLTLLQSMHAPDTASESEMHDNQNEKCTGALLEIELPQPEYEQVSDCSEEEPVSDDREEELAPDHREQETVSSHSEQESVSDQSEQEPVSDHNEPVSDHSEQEPVSDDSEQEPVSDHPEQEPVSDHPEQEPVSDGSEQEPISDHPEQELVSDHHTQEQASVYSEQQPASDHPPQKEVPAVETYTGSNASEEGVVSQNSDPADNKDPDEEDVGAGKILPAGDTDGSIVGSQVEQTKAPCSAVTNFKTRKRLTYSSEGTHPPSTMDNQAATEEQEGVIQTSDQNNARPEEEEVTKPPDKTTPIEKPVKNKSDTQAEPKTMRKELASTSADKTKTTLHDSPTVSSETNHETAGKSTEKTQNTKGESNKGNKTSNAKRENLPVQTKRDNRKAAKNTKTVGNKTNAETNSDKTKRVRQSDPSRPDTTEKTSVDLPGQTRRSKRHSLVQQQDVSSTTNIQKTYSTSRKDNIVMKEATVPLTDILTSPKSLTHISNTSPKNITLSASEASKSRDTSQSLAHNNSSKENIEDGHNNTSKNNVANTQYLNDNNAVKSKVNGNVASNQTCPKECNTPKENLVQSTPSENITNSNKDSSRKSNNMEPTEIVNKGVVNKDSTEPTKIIMPPKVTKQNKVDVPIVKNNINLDGDDLNDLQLSSPLAASTAYGIKLPRIDEIDEDEDFYLECLKSKSFRNKRPSISPRKKKTRKQSGSNKKVQRPASNVSNKKIPTSVISDQVTLTPLSSSPKRPILDRHSPKIVGNIQVGVGKFGSFSHTKVSRDGLSPGKTVPESNADSSEQPEKTAGNNKGKTLGRKIDSIAADLASKAIEQNDNAPMSTANENDSPPNDHPEKEQQNKRSLKRSRIPAQNKEKKANKRKNKTGVVKKQTEKADIANLAHQDSSKKDTNSVLPVTYETETVSDKSVIGIDKNVENVGCDTQTNNANIPRQVRNKSRASRKADIASNSESASDDENSEPPIKSARIRQRKPSPENADSESDQNTAESNSAKGYRKPLPSFDDNNSDQAIRSSDEHVPAISGKETVSSSQDVNEKQVENDVSPDTDVSVYDFDDPEVFVPPLSPRKTTLENEDMTSIVQKKKRRYKSGFYKGTRKRSSRSGNAGTKKSENITKSNKSGSVQAPNLAPDESDTHTLNKDLPSDETTPSGLRKSSRSSRLSSRKKLLATKKLLESILRKSRGTKKDESRLESMPETPSPAVVTKSKKSKRMSSFVEEDLSMMPNLYPTGDNTAIVSPPKKTRKSILKKSSGSNKGKTGNRKSVVVKTPERRSHGTKSADPSVKSMLRGRSSIGLGSTTLPSMSCSPQHVFEQTHSTDVTHHPTAKPPTKSVKIVIPDVTDAEGVRRSRRVRVKPLEWHKNERIEYQKRKSGGFVIAGIIPPVNEEEPLDPKEKRRQNILKLSKKKRTPKMRSAKNLSIHGHIDDHVQLQEPSKSTISVLNPDTEEEEIVDCIKSSKQLKLITPAGDKAEADDPLAVCRVLAQKAFTIGKLNIRPLQKKPRQLVNKDSMSFIIKYGKLAVTIHETTTILETDDVFCVPKGNWYSIENLRRDEASLWFFHHKG